MGSSSSRKATFLMLNNKVYVGAMLPMSVQPIALDKFGLTTSKLPVIVEQPFWYPVEPTKHGRTVFSSLLPKTMAALKSIKYLPVLKLAHHSNSVDLSKVHLCAGCSSFPVRSNDKAEGAQFWGELLPRTNPAAVPSTNSIESNWIGSKLVRHPQHSFGTATSGHYRKRDAVKLIGTGMIIPKADDINLLNTDGEMRSDSLTKLLKFAHDIPTGTQNVANVRIVKRDLTSSADQDDALLIESEKDDNVNFIKIESIRTPDDSLESSRQNQHMVPSWTTIQYNRRPVINTPWMKDTQGVAMNTMNNVNGAMLELSDTDIQRETAKANLLLVQRMAELVLAEKDKVKAEMNRVQTDLERLGSERDRNLMEIQKLDMEREMYEAKLLSGTARGDLYKKSMPENTR